MFLFKYFMFYLNSFGMGVGLFFFYCMNIYIADNGRRYVRWS